MKYPFLNSMIYLTEYNYLYNMPNSKERCLMSALNKNRLQNSVEIFKALAHPSRLIILEALAKRKHCVNELTELVGADMSTVSRHLAQLRNAGLVRDKKQGLQVFYELRCRCVLTFLDCVESVTAEREETACDCG